MRIDRCICFNRTFAELRSTAEAHGAQTVEDLQGVAEFGQNCGLCRPYVREMLTTGEVVFHRIISDGPESGRDSDA